MEQLTIEDREIVDIEIVDPSALMDSRLSLSARGFLLLFGELYNEGINLSKIIEMNKEHEDEILKAMEELLEYGYIREETDDKGDPSYTVFLTKQK